jgi:hypothetical protein
MSQSIHSVSQGIGFVLVRFQEGFLRGLVLRDCHKMTLLKIDFPVPRISKQPNPDFGSKTAQAERHLADKDFGIP